MISVSSNRLGFVFRSTLLFVVVVGCIIMLSVTSRAATSSASTSLRRKASTKVSTIIFDVDDTLYDVASGFTAHRNGEIIWKYMVEHLHFDSLESARKLRDEYFEIYHSTAKALTVAQADGKFPKGAPVFDAKHMSQYWVDHLDYDKLFGTFAHSSLEESKNAKEDFVRALQTCPSQLVAFSNGPRSYVMKVLDKLGMLELFGTDRKSKDGAFVWGVDDVLPHCKPEKEAFESIFAKLQQGKDQPPIDPTECIMVEDSMKNVRAAKALGMKTILITGSKEEGRILPNDAPTEDDPAVDVAIATVEEMRTRLPGLWQDPPLFEP